MLGNRLGDPNAQAGSARLPLTVVTDHMALKWLNSIESPSGRIARWALDVQQYDFEIAHRKGQLKVVADALSRQPLPEAL